MKGKMASAGFERLKLVLTDWISANLSVMLFNLLRFSAAPVREHNVDAYLSYILQPKLCLEQILIPICLLGLYWLSGFYNHPFGKSRVSETANSAIVSGISTIIIHLCLLTNDQLDNIEENMIQILLIFMIFFTFTTAGRLLAINSQISHFKRREWKYTIVVVGNSAKAHDLAGKLSCSKAVISYHVEGFFSLPGERDVKSGAWPMSRIEEICSQRKIDHIILAPEDTSEANVLSLVYRLFPLGKPIKLSPDTLNFMTSAIRLRDIHGYPLIDLTHSSMGEAEKNVKRTFDVAASILTLTLLSPLFLLLAIWVKADSRGTVFYRQERIGRKQKPFDIIKFRSMRPDAEDHGPQLSSDDDPRTTRCGRIMRKYRLDELPQFWNVLKGEMSIVGPRPEREHFIREIMKTAPYYTLLYQATPGITSWGMVKYGYASEVGEMVERSKYDLLYISNMSLLMDLKIMLYTVKTILEGRGK